MITSNFKRGFEKVAVGMSAIRGSTTKLKLPKIPLAQHLEKATYKPPKPKKVEGWGGVFGKSRL